MLGRTALRVAAIEALKGRTLVENEVRDSEFGAIDITSDGALRTDKDRPFISVYVEDAKETDRLESRALYRSGETQFILEIGIASPMVETNDAGESTVIGVGLPPTDAAFEFYLDMVGRQAVDALTDPTNAWAEIWRSLSSGVRKIERKRTADATTGTRIAAHQIVVTLDLLPDPVAGEPMAPTSAWARLFAAMDAGGHPYAALMRSAVERPKGGHADQLRRRTGMTLDELRALLDIAVEPAEATEPDIEVIEVERHGHS
ncbi:MAG: hypothetical protein ACT6QU_02175 [Aliihoeflea sp.]|uniref:hypothetical protein n=1 Tax=Aliihoeflea sp. TaxID=2608088 RepID=UPI004033DA12